MSFLEDIKAFRKAALQEASQATNQVAYDLFTEIVALSPSPSNPGYSAKGLLANQWYTEVGGGFSTEISSATNDIGIDSISRVSATLSTNPFEKGDNTITFTNNTQEAYFAEVTGWPKGLGTNGKVWSGNVGPYAMVANSINYIIGKYE